jgi:hypothetical protein
MAKDIPQDGRLVQFGQEVIKVYNRKIGMVPSRFAVGIYEISKRIEQRAFEYGLPILVGGLDLGFRVSDRRGQGENRLA